MSDMTHKTVPVEPTNEMFEAAREYYCKLHPNCGVWPCGEAMGIYAAMLAAAPPSPVTELEVMLYEALRAFRDGGPEGGTDFNGWHQSYEEPCRLAREALAAYEAKKETK